MKKITTILMLLMLSMGVWAQETTVWFKQADDGNNVTRGTFHNNDGSVNENASAFVFFWKSGTDEPVITLRASNNPQNVGVMARENSRLTANGNPTYEISVSEGYIIKSYYIKFINFNDATKPKTLTTEFGPSAVTEGSERGTGSGNPKDAEVTVTDVNKVATTFTVSSADDKAIKIKEFYVVVEEKSDYTDQINTNIKPWIESIGNGYFTLDPNNTYVLDLQTAYNSHTMGDTWTKDEYNSLLALLTAAKTSENAYIMPETGYYRIKNNALDFYAGYSEGSNPAADNRATGASTVVYLEKDETTGKYAIKINGKYIQTTGINYNSGGTFTMGDDVAYFNVFARGNINSDGKGTGSFTALDDESGTNRSYLIIENSPAPSHGTPLTAYGPGKIGSHWILEVATTLELSLTNIAGKNYATTCLPFPVKLSEEAAYKVTLSGKKAVEDLIGDEIPAGEAVLLMSDASTTLTATIQDVTTTVDGNQLNGVFVKTAKADLGTTPVVLNKVNDKVGFYKLADGSSLSANRAYLSYVEGTTSPSSKAFFEEGFELGGNEVTAIENIENGAFENGAVYNLQGQRVGKAQKGVFIQNGKKVVLK